MQRSNPKRCRADRLEANWSKDGQAEAHRVCGSEKKDRDRSAITVEKDWSREKVESRNPAQNFVPIFCNYPQTRQSETDFALSTARWIFRSLKRLAGSELRVTQRHRANNKAKHRTLYLSY